MFGISPHNKLLPPQYTIKWDKHRVNKDYTVEDLAIEDIQWSNTLMWQEKYDSKSDPSNHCIFQCMNHDLISDPRHIQFLFLRGQIIITLCWGVTVCRMVIDSEWPPHACQDSEGWAESSSFDCTCRVSWGICDEWISMSLTCIISIFL